MLRKVFSVLVLWTGLASAQNPLALQVGNMWEYHSSDPMDPTRLRMAVTGDTVLPNARSYFVLSGSIFMAPFLRLDSSRVFAHPGVSSDEFKLFDFLARPGDTISFLNGRQNTILLRDAWFDTTSHHRNWYFILYQGTPPQWYEFLEWWIQDSLGVTFLRGEPGMSWYLSGARIRGDTIGTLTSVRPRPPAIPGTPILRQNYPNPFNPATAIGFDLPKEQVAVVSILNVLGQEVEKVFAGKAERGRTRVIWNASGRPTGVYFVRLETAGFVQTRKLILLK